MIQSRICSWNDLRECLNGFLRVVKNIDDQVTILISMDGTLHIINKGQILPLVLHSFKSHIILLKWNSAAAIICQYGFYCKF